MVKDITIQEKEFASHIYQLRMDKKYDMALNMCDESIEQFNDNNFFYKIKGDILFEIREYEKSLNCYIDYLELIKMSPELFTNFSKYFIKIQSVYPVKKDVFRKILLISKDRDCSSVIARGLRKIICDYWTLSYAGEKLVDKVNSNFSKDCVDSAFVEINSKEPCEKICFLSKLDINNCNINTQVIAKKIIKAMEENQMFQDAIRWVLYNLEFCKDNVLVRTLFRICRIRNDYTEAIAYMQNNDVFKTQDFNLWYELVLFYNFHEDEENRNIILEKIDETYPESMPISNTLFKFYVEYDMLDKARNIEKRMDSLSALKKDDIKKSQEYEKTVQETREFMWQRLNDLLEEQEHNRQLLAITELIKGFSHELGQPITNIRYAIQLYNMKNEKNGIAVDDEQRQLLDGILKQTGRVGKLLGRFAPIVSSKNIKTKFVVYNEIKSIFEELEIRLNSAGIKYFIHGDKNAVLYGETLQFSQIFYNLIINSIYAIDKKKVDGVIVVEIENKNPLLIIRFKDNGIGIPKDAHRKIFEPFYSTKRKDFEEKGPNAELKELIDIVKSKLEPMDEETVKRLVNSTELMRKE